MKDFNIKKYTRILEKLEKKDYSIIARLYILYIAKDCENFQILSEEAQKKLINYLYIYYLDNETNEDFFTKMIYFLLDDKNFDNIKNIENIKYIDFEYYILNNYTY